MAGFVGPEGIFQLAVSRSTIPLLCGWKAVGRLREMPNLAHRIDHTTDVNCGPRSEVMHSGTPNLATHVATKMSAHDVVEMSLRGMASNHLVDLLIMVNM
jgi:hypothetical protein